MQAGADQGRHNIILQINLAHYVIFCIGDIKKLTIVGERHSLWMGEGGLSKTSIVIRQTTAADNVDHFAIRDAGDHDAIMIGVCNK